MTRQYIKSKPLDEERQKIADYNNSPKSTRYKPPRKGMFDKGKKVIGYESKKEMVTVSFD